MYDDNLHSCPKTKSQILLFLRGNNFTFTCYFIQLLIEVNTKYACYINTYLVCKVLFGANIFE